MPPQSPTRKRIEYIDLLRGWAVIVMIQTHVFNATLRSVLTDGSVYAVVKFVDGLVAPTFLFASGLAYAVTTRRKVNDYLSFGTPLFKQLWRLLFVLLVGYSLHIPKFNYPHLRYEAGERAWQLFFQVDVLQCIAVSLLFMQLLLLALRSERRLYPALIAITVGVVLGTPLIWGIDFWAVLPIPLAAYLNGTHDSLFPLFPWSAFLFAGAITGHYYNRAKESADGGSAATVDRMMKTLAGASLAAVALSFVLDPLAASLYPVYDYWKTSPSFYLLRLGLVGLVCSGLFLYERREGVSPSSLVTLIGRESLLVYTVHLLLVYGNFSTFNFHEKVNKSFGYTEAIVVTLTLFGLMVLLALVWERIKRGPTRVKRGTQAILLAIFLGVFFFGPGQ